VVKLGFLAHKKRWDVFLSVLESVTNSVSQRQLTS